MEDDENRPGEIESPPKDKIEDKDDEEEAEEEIPMVASADASGQSRLSNEFEVKNCIDLGQTG